MIRLGNYSTGANARFVILEGITVWFSYATPVAIGYVRADGETVRIVRANEWGPTTGRHLNAIDNGNGSRWNSDRFETLLSALLGDSLQRAVKALEV